MPPTDLTRLHQPMVRLGVRPSLPAYCRDLWRRREFVLTMPLGQLQSRNTDTALGWVWHLLNPLILAGVFYVVFGVIFEARADVDNYVVFLVAGLFVFYFTQKCLVGGAQAVVSNAGIIRNVNLPRATFPLGNTISELLVHLPAIALLLVLAVATGEAPRLSWLALVPLLALQTAFNLGLALWAARLTFHLRDVQRLLPYATRLWLYLSGVFYTVERVPEGWARDAFEANPLHLLMEMHRSALTEGLPTAGQWLALVGWASLLITSGLVFFWRGEDRYGRD